MTRPLEFLQAILPPDGYFAVVGIKNKNVQQVLVDKLEAIGSIVEAAVANKEDVYFGCSAYLTGANRTKANVKYVKAFWLDLDCGEGTAYPEIQDGFNAVRAFCRDAGMPKPWVVNSGRGLHVYWPLVTPILMPLWSTYAVRLVELCAAKGLEIKDPGCSTDAARILRIPGTFNFKNRDDPRDVTILLKGVSTEWGSLKDTIQSACGVVGINGFHEKPAPLPRRPIDPLTAALAGNTSSNFVKIAKRSLADNGCVHIKNALLDQESTPEPVWRSVLSIAQFCEDRDKAIHKVSEGHPEYTAANTEKKAAAILGPYSCAKFAEVCGPAACTTCTVKAIVNNPIQLGRIMAKPTDPIALFNKDEGSVHGSTTIAEGVTEASLLPDLPFPYTRGINGGIYTPGVPFPDGTVGDPQIVYEYNLDVIRRVKDPEKGETLVIHLDLPQDGVREIIMPLADAQSIDRMKDILGFHGVAASKKQMEQIGIYMTKVVKHMQSTAPAESAHTQMGWDSDKRGIVWGRTLFTKQGPQYCPPAHKAATVANMMKESGSFDVWQSIADRYAAPGFELYACCMLMAFGSMLNPYTYEDPVWIHLVSSDSGTGKTTLMRMMNSIWGDPTAMGLTATDTVNSVEKRRVVFNHMALCQDEITNMPPEKLSQLAYSQSQGREKLRLTSGSQEMVNNDRRNNTYFSTGNRYISDVLSAFKTNADGEFARLIEVPFAPLKNRVSGDDHFGKVLKHYGHAGPQFAKWLVSNEDQLQRRVDKWRARFERDFHSVSKERNWVATTAAGFAAGKILQDELGILKSYNLEVLYKYWTSHMNTVRETTASQIVSHENLLGDFINENYANIIIPDANVAAAASASPATASLYGRKTEREARNKLVIRWEKDTHMLYIAQNDLKAYCTKRTHSFIDLLAHYHTSAQFKGIVLKRLGDRTVVVTSPVKCLAFKITDGLLGATLEDV